MGGGGGRISHVMGMGDVMRIRLTPGVTTREGCTQSFTPELKTSGISPRGPVKQLKWPDQLQTPLTRYRQYLCVQETGQLIEGFTGGWRPEDSEHL